ncbi:acyl-CoA dehydrogenase family protein [Streptomyces yokosukanensis]|uniref:acyl-CoA dehydrogenase family protein n=1 Tax=Streptomyces yokosukanensis TaxID=67386 RepID=UPI00342A5F80
MHNGDCDADAARRLVDEVGFFAEREVPRYLAGRPEEEYPDELVKRLRLLGVFGADVPVRYGGLGCGEATTARLLYLLARSWQSLASLVGTHLKLCGQMLRHGTDEQRSAWLPVMSCGEAVFARAYHEQGCSDPELLTTHVRDSAGRRTLHGRKDWVTNARHADRILVLARDGRATLGILVDPTADGVRIGPELPRPGVLGVSLASVTFDGCAFDPERDVLGGPGHDLTDSLRAGDLRSYTTRAVACAEAVCDQAARFAARTIGRRPPDAQGAIRLRVGEVRARTAAMRAIWTDLLGPAPTIGPDEAKVVCTALLQEIVQACVLLCGGAGYADPHDSLGRHYRDALALPIVGASNDTLLSRIGSAALATEEAR